MYGDYELSGIDFIISPRWTYMHIGELSVTPYCFNYIDNKNELYLFIDGTPASQYTEPRDYESIIMKYSNKRLFVNERIAVVDEESTESLLEYYNKNYSQITDAIRGTAPNT